MRGNLVDKPEGLRISVGWVQLVVHEFENLILECERIKQPSKEGYSEEFTQGVEVQCSVFPGN